MAYLGLAFKVAKLLKNYGPQILHGTDTDLLTRDLGDALRRQKKIITDPDLGAIETAAEIGPVVAEVKLLTLFVSRKNGIDTKGKSAIAILEEIVQKTEGRKSDAADGVKDTLDWTRTFFSDPKIQEILKSDMTEIEMPRNMTDVLGLGKTFTQSAVRATQEVARLNEFLKTAKTVTPESKPAPKARKPKKGGPSQG